MSPALQIAFLSRDLPSRHPNGVSCQVDLLANALVARGHRVTVFSLDPKPDGSPYEVVCPSRPENRSRLSRIFYPAVYFARACYRNFDILHAHGDNYLTSRSHIPVVRTFYGSALWEALYDPRFAYRMRQMLFYPLEWVSAWRSDACVGISAATRRALPHVTKVIPCGIDSRVFHPGGNLSPEPSILFVGNLSGRKRGNLLMRLFVSKVLPEMPTARLRLVTGSSVDPHPNIDIFPMISQEELVRLYRNSWVCCSTSRYEGFGVPVLEAMACATPVISTPHMGAREILKHEENGLLLPVADLAGGILRLLGDDNLRKRMAARALNTVKAYSSETAAGQYEEVYANAIDGQRG